MANVAVVGTGYVGSVTAVCLAWLGHEVVGFDTNPARAEQLSAGELPIYEPGLQDKLDEAIATGRLRFTADAADAAREADVIFLCVGTPTGLGGMPDMSQVQSAAHGVAPYLKPGAVVVNKSTVPVGSGNWVRTIIEEAQPTVTAPASTSCPTRSSCARARRSRTSSTRTGSCSAAKRRRGRADRRLAVRAGAEAGLPRRAAVDCTRAGADRPAVRGDGEVRRQRVSRHEDLFRQRDRQHLRAGRRGRAAGAAGDRRGHPDRRRSSCSTGIGWGGSCFGKDVQALIATGLDYGYGSQILRATVEVNQAQRAAVIRKLQAELKTIKGRRIAVLGTGVQARHRRPPGRAGAGDHPAVAHGRCGRVGVRPDRQGRARARGRAGADRVERLRRC